MRKILLILIIVLLLVLGYIISVNGIEISNFKIWSVKQLAESNKNLDAKIEQINSLIDIQYPKKISDIKTAGNNIKTAKEEYFNYTNLSSDEEILKAMQEESYSIEFLWTKIGNHATSEGVNLKFEVISSSTGASNTNDLSFTVQGTYIGITNFIYAIENDDQLNFRIQDFKLLPYNGNVLQGTFTVRNIGIQGNTSNQSIENETLNKEDNTEDQGNTQNGNSNEKEQNTNSVS